MWFWWGTGESIFQNACGLYGTVDTVMRVRVMAADINGVASCQSNKPTSASKREVVLEIINTRPTGACCEALRVGVYT